jgi:hypothetical protein
MPTCGLKYGASKMAKAKTTKKKPKKKERGATYWLNRLKKENPKIHDDFFAGAYPSVNKACEAAGMKPPSTGLEALKRIWKRSSASDQDTFLMWVKPAAAGKTASIATRPIADSTLCLSREVRDFLASWIFYNGSKAGRVMQELGFSSSDTSLSAAIKYGAPFRQEVIDQLGPWLTKNGFGRSAPFLGR